MYSKLRGSFFASSGLTDLLGQRDQLAQVFRVVVRILLLLIDERVQELGQVVVVAGVHHVLVHNGLAGVVDGRLRRGSTSPRGSAQRRNRSASPPSRSATRTERS